MPTLEVLDKKGKSVSTVEFTKELLEIKTDPKVIRDTVAAYLANNRSGTASTKIKKELSYSGAKPWKQKGTGRARCGEKNSPLWRGGGVVFGPRPRSFRIDLPKQVKGKALKQVLADKLNNKLFIVVESLEMEKPKTKDFIEILKNLKADGTSSLVILGKDDKNAARSAHNIAGIKIVDAGGVNTFDILAHKNVIITKDAFEQLMKRLNK